MPKKISTAAAASAGALTHVAWTGKGAGAFFDRERPELSALGLRIDLTLKKGTPVPVGDKAGQCPPALAEQLVKDGRASYRDAAEPDAPDAPGAPDAPPAGTTDPAAPAQEGDGPQE